ncbi:hypothetical protein CMQ_3472 [Grosmannia clavigera kw1407]|uniref:Acid phosphatase-like protein n=1 Tax=Grosmannia clavigera (strain kw1407 / UAMH 11150) TaxID=655863 RepID=F0XAE3_GROCL|nr:uncharacterized protein CMQ_3472 [Grosmannia clavigera kw1407]EFX05403.1 hypothetical protein CMQ_3472 [Grosmannia clavigera kw1407]
MKTAGVVILVIVLLLVAAAAGWVLFTRLRAQRQGLPPPALSSLNPFSSTSSYGVQPAPSGVSGWISDRLRGFKARNNRTAAGAYEGGVPQAAGRTRNGFGPLDPDDAWDARVGNEAEAYYYNEEQELGLQPAYPGAAGLHNSSRLDVTNTAYLGSGGLGGSTYDMNLAGQDRGRSHPQAGRNPFDDEADDSHVNLRGVSPRPMSDPITATAGSGAKDNTKADSPTERRSMFRENV